MEPAILPQSDLVAVEMSAAQISFQMLLCASVCMPVLGILHPHPEPRYGGRHDSNSFLGYHLLQRTSSDFL